jgi:hypothetical protein
MLDAAFTAQNRVTEIQARLQVGRGSTPAGEAARKILIRAYSQLLAAISLAEAIQSDTLEIAACSDVSCMSPYVTHSASLVTPLRSKLIAYYSLRNAAIHSLMGN